MSRCQVVSFTPTGGQPRALGTLGQVSGLTFSSAVPGGYDQLQCTLNRPPNYRSDAMVPGRLVRVYCGASVVWEGTMLEPAPSNAGWTITAIGNGSWGTNFVALYTVSWTTGVMGNIVNQAISRGLRWVNGGIDAPPGGGWLGQQVDSGAQTVTDALNLYCSNGGLTWQVGRGNILTVFSLPTTPNRRLIATAPVTRTLGGDINSIYLRYASTADAQGTPRTYLLTNVTDAASIAQFGTPMEDFVDLSSVGTEAATAAQAVGNAILQRYQKASYAGPFTARQGQLTNLGGQPIDLATEMAGTVVKLVMTDFTYGAEEQVGPVQFLVGNYEYDDDAQTATITPFQNINTDISQVNFEPFVDRVTGADRRFARHARAEAEKKRRERIARRHAREVEARKDRRQRKNR